MTPERKKAIFERIDRATEVPMLLLALAFLIAIALPEVSDLSEEALATLESATWIVWAAFAFELLVKTYLSEDRRQYLLAHWMDVATVFVPFLRPLRLLRVLAVGVRFWVEARTVLRHRTFSFIGAVSVLAVASAAALVYALERNGDGPIQSYGDALWWAAATITTVGYGDVFPKTPAGRGVAVLLMLIGISLFGVLTARVAAFFVEEDGRTAEGAKLDELLDRVRRVEARLESSAEDSGTVGQGWLGAPEASRVSGRPAGRSRLPASASSPTSPTTQGEMARLTALAQREPSSGPTMVRGVLETGKPPDGGGS